MHQHYLHRAFEPHSIAVIGASERDDAVGGIVLRNLEQAGFTGDLYAVNPNRECCGDRDCFPSITAIDHSVDLAIIAIPSKQVPAVMEPRKRKLL